MWRTLVMAALFGPLVMLSATAHGWSGKAVIIVEGLAGN